MTPPDGQDQTDKVEVIRRVFGPLHNWIKQIDAR